MTLLWMLFVVFLAIAAICALAGDEFWFVVLCVAIAFGVVALIASVMVMFGAATWS